ncbi:10037_t:CDS:2 [Rhizophagus irregularis]|nr:10037_t:CDS:2 [Rhizophagus irregularis]
MKLLKGLLIADYISELKIKNFKEFVANIKELPRTEGKANRSLITHYGASKKAKCREGQYLEIGGKLRDIWFSSDLLDL